MTSKTPRYIKEQRKEIAPQPPPMEGRHSKLKAIARKTLKYLVGALTLLATSLGIATGYLSLLPKVSITPYVCFWQVGLAHFGGLIWPTHGR
jgi:hypothetical protein